MNIHWEPMTTDEDIDNLVEWLNHKEVIHKKAIELVVSTLIRLKADRALLARELMEHKNV